MGVSGLWPLLDSSSKTVSLAALSLREFSSQNRGYRLGIDASIWLFHADYGKGGTNPQLRTLFFRCATLLRYPILPLFIFDGPKRPDWKRGKKINKTANKLTTGMKTIIEAFGFEWRTAPVEAEAELAYLNATGFIDGVLTDDVDAFVFGAHTVVRKPLSRNSSNKKWTNVRVCADTDLELSRADLILIALCSGGDYCEAGLPSCGIETAHALARAGLAASLYKTAINLSRSELPTFLATWRTELKEELRTDSHGYIGRKMVALAKSVPASFPNVDILLAYTHPVTSRSEGNPDYYADIAWTSKEPQIPGLAGFCEGHFEWGFKELIIKRFRTLIRPGTAFRVLRRYTLDDGTEKAFTLFSGDHPVPGDGPEWMKKIHSKREHHSTDKTPEYRVEIDPSVLVKLAEAGLKGDPEDDPAAVEVLAKAMKDSQFPDEEESEASDDERADKGKKKGPVDPLKPLRLWLSVVLVQEAQPKLVEAFEEVLRKKQEKKAPQG
ncbi:PIN domain-like protein, partial [Armillaria solidipes]